MEIANGLSYMYVHMPPNNSVDLAYYDIARTNVGKGGINFDTENANFIL